MSQDLDPSYDLQNQGISEVGTAGVTTVTPSQRTYFLATEGINSQNTFTIASSGYSFLVEVEELQQIPKRGKAPATIYDTQKPEEEARNKITVTAIIGGKKYTEVAYTSKAKVKASDVEIKVTGDADKPVIKVEIK